MLRERLGVSERERRERCERLEQLLFVGAEGPGRVVHRNPDHAERLAARDHRRDERTRITVIRVVRHVGKRGVGRALEPDELRRKPMHGRAPKDIPLAIEEVTVRCIGVEQLRHLLDEAVEDDVELELSRHDLRGL